MQLTESAVVDVTHLHYGANDVCVAMDSAVCRGQSACRSSHFREYRDIGWCVAVGC